MEHCRIASVSAGAAVADVTPDGSVFLYGYPHVERMSTGVHDRLICSSLFLSNGFESVLAIGNDLVYVAKTTAGRARRRIERETGIPASHVIVTATHTHSGPMTRTQDLYSLEEDRIASQADPKYIARLEDCIVDAGVRAVRNARPAEIGLGVADGSCVGTNRHDPKGITDSQAPVLAVRDRQSGKYLAAMLIGTTHPTVLHEDSTLISGDFPAAARRYLQERVLGKQCVIVYHTGPCGDQSPRHVVRANTFAEAERLGVLLGQAVEKIVPTIAYRSEIDLECVSASVDLPPRVMLAEAEARERLQRLREEFERLRRNNAPRGELRTAECDLFGAENMLTLARAAAAGRLNAVLSSTMPAEVAAMRIGPWRFVFWPGEVYVEFALRVKARFPACYVISLANGELHGYLATEEAVRQGHYEANSGIFANPDSGNMLVCETLKLLTAMENDRPKEGLQT